MQVTSHDKWVGNALADHLDGVGPAGSSPEHLADLAHTLARSRADLSWRVAVTAADLEDLTEQLRAGLPEEAVRKPESPPRIGLVFTGQGAQSPGMGLELCGRPVFDASLRKSSDVLRQLGCGWDPVKELAKDPADSRLGIPEVAQPICTILQLALVDELLSWGVQPVATIGHSSGEIAAAYTAGALTHADAVAVAYFRGMSCKDISHQGLNGGMLAGGCSPETANEIIASDESIDGRVGVACVNSPSSVTLSGDADALDSLQSLLVGRGIFARRLKVNVAYHSHHMTAAMDQYAESISHISAQASRSAGPRMVSSVMGAHVDAEALGPFYWVRNLISPVLFSDALKELIIPETNDGRPTVDTLIEIGPHGALAGPIEQILSHHGIENVDYKSMLTRNQNAQETVLRLGKELLLAGSPVSITKVNGDEDSRFLTDLPPYAWNHSKSFRADSRLHREHINPKFARQSLIGTPLPKMSENQHTWRNMLRLADEPWLRGHTVGSTVLFPGAAIVSSVLESTKQLADPGKTVKSFILREVNLFAAIALPEDVAVEMIIHLRPHLIATSGSTPSEWWEWTVSSCIGTDQLRDNARGLITIEYTETQSAPASMEEQLFTAAQVADHQSIKKECAEPYTHGAFYQHMAKASWAYGELFQGCENVHVGNGKTWFDIRVVDIGETFSRGQRDRPFLINGATLDAVFQSWLGSTYKHGEFEFKKPFVPTFIAELEVAADIPGAAPYTMPGHCRSERHGFNELSSDIILFDAELSRVLLAVRDFRSSELDVDVSNPDGGPRVDPTDITSLVQWDAALHALDVDDMRTVIKGASKREKILELVRLCLHDVPSATVLEVMLPESGSAEPLLASLPAHHVFPRRLRCTTWASANPPPATSADMFAPVSCWDGPERNLSADEARSDVLVIEELPSSPTGVDRLIEAIEQHLAAPNPVWVVGAPDVNIAQHLSTLGFEVLPTRGSGGSVAVKRTRPAKARDMAHEGHDIVIVTRPRATHISQTFAESLQQEFGGRGCQATVVPWDTDRGTSDGTGKSFVLLLELETPFLESVSEQDFEKLRDMVLTGEKMLWITCGDNPSNRMVDGFSRCIRSEIAGKQLRLLHLSAATGLRHGPSLARRVWESTAADSEYQEADGVLQVARIYRSPQQNGSIRAHLQDVVTTTKLSDTEPTLALTIGRPGLLDTLRFERDDRLEAPMAPSEVEIQVQAVGVNFRDVMACMGLITVPGLGQEASGIVVKVGDDVTALKVGDRVATTCVRAAATRIRADHGTVARVPDAMSMEEAAALPVVHTTAFYALVRVARMQRGQSVLVHAAAGGVGQAAIQLAQHLGLVIFATVGTPDKRDLLMHEYGVPPEHIFGSRDASFVKGIARVTRGRGVDCVLNSLSGELLRASLACLATFGSFIEIGLRDITNNTRLDLRPFRNSISFTFVNMYNVYAHDLPAFRSVFADTFALIGRGVLRAPAPVDVHPVQSVGDAFRIMQQGKHRGKLVLSFDRDAAPVPVFSRAADRLRLDPHATYLIVGGLGGLGRSLAKHFVACGAKHIAFVSRSGDASPDAQASLDALGRAGATARAFRADIADRASFAAAMAACEAELPPVRGVVQMAMVLRDVVFEKMSFAEWSAPVRPKVHGTRHVHDYFDAQRPLDFMILCSSSSGVYGYPSQAPYAAGNTYQDAVARLRRSHGLPAIAVNLGIMRDVGILAETGTTGNIRLWEERHQPDYPAQVCTGLGTADIMAAHGLATPAYFDDPRFASLAVRSAVSADARGDTARADPAIASRLAHITDRDEANAVVTAALVHQTAEILQVLPDEIDASRPLYRYGVDSLVAIEVRNWITRELGANMALLEILAAVPIESFAAKIVEKSNMIAVV
ncbi:hypothetical protein BST61_g7637 [Cercospora zeina]